MGENERWAAESRSLLEKSNTKMINLIGSPGAGKTTILEKLAQECDVPFSVLEGDIETTHDAERLEKVGIPAAQLLSGGACHLEAKLVHAALADLDLPSLGMVVVENVGNMVCPAEFDVGENAKIAVVSVTEGEDKPLKYPLLFQEAKAVLVTKTDLLPHLQFNLELLLENIHRVNGNIPVFQLGNKGGFQQWVAWLKKL